MHQKINSTSFLIAITAEIACAMFACASALGAAGGVNNVPNLPASSGAAIYKMVDASGRVTYTNSPTKGANKVALDPITVIPATPAGMLGDGQSFRQNMAKGATQNATQGAAQNASQATPSAPFAAVAQSALSPLLIPVGVAPTIAQPEEPTPMPANAPSAAAAAPAHRFSPPPPAKPMATAVVTAVPANTASSSATKLSVVKLSPTTVAPAKVEVAAKVAAPPALPLVAFAPTAPTFAAAPATAATINTSAINVLPGPQLQSSASPVRVMSTNQAAKINQQEQLLATARAQLVEEQRASESFRALRARLPAVIDQTNPAKAAIQNDIKTQVEQHFERIRNLQDQISQYEHNQAALQPPSPGQLSFSRPSGQPISQMRAHSSNAASAAVNSVASQ